MQDWQFNNIQCSVTDLCHQPTHISPNAPRLAEGLAQAGVHARREQRQRLPCQRGVRTQRLGRRSALEPHVCDPAQSSAARMARLCCVFI